MDELHFETYGKPTNPAVLLLHGFMSCNGQWLMNTETLAEDYFLVAVELWGHGRSPTPEKPEFYSISAYAQQLEAIRQKLAIESWAVVGQSYGAGIVLNYAIDHPTVCTAAVVTNSRSAFGSMPSGDRRRANAEPPSDLRKLPYHPIHARRFPEHVKARLVASADAMNPRSIQLGGRLGASLNCRELVGAFPLPLLITNGRYEAAFQEDLSSLREKIPNLNIVDLDGGHSVNIEASDGFNEAVCAFLENCWKKG